MSKADENKKQKKNALLNTAFDLFLNQGIQKTSISDIVQRAGVAKGTFYLYFTDKYDLRNKLIAHQASQLFYRAKSALNGTALADNYELTPRIIFMVNHIIDQLNENKSLLSFISKNLSWGIFKSSLLASQTDDIDFFQIFEELFRKAPRQYQNPEVLVFMIVELVSSTCYSAILYNEPVSVDTLKPFLFSTIKEMIKSQEKQ